MTGAPARGEAAGGEDARLQLVPGRARRQAVVGAGGEGLAGLLLSRDPGLTVAQLKAAILGTVDSVTSVEAKLVTGGRANARAARATIASVPGDITGDGRLNLADAVAALRLIAGLPTERFRNPDLDAIISGESEIGLAEALFILQSIAGVR